MITAGIDMGAKTKVVILNGDKVVAKSLVLTGFEPQEAADKAMADALAQANICRYFVFEQDRLYIQHESELLQHYLQHGKLPEGNDELADLF